MSLDQIGERPFFGRRDALALLEKRYSAFVNGFKQNIGILGPLGVGKTALIETFLKKSAHPSILTVPFHCRGHEGFDQFAQRWMSELLFSVYQLSGGEIPGDFQSLWKRVRTMIPKTLRRMKLVKKTLRQGRFENAYRELIALSGTAASEINKRVLFIVEDFDRLGDLPVSDPFSSLGREIMMQKETMFVVTSARLSSSRHILGEKMSLLFGNFEVVELGGLGFEEVNEVFAHFLGARIMSAELKRFLIRLTDGIPYYLCRLLARLPSPAMEAHVSWQEVSNSLAAEMFEESGALNQYFTKRLYESIGGRKRGNVADVLIAVSRGCRKLTEIVRFLHLKTSEAKRVLEQLIKLEILDRHGVLHVIRDPLFRFWAGKAYYRKRFFSVRAPQSTVRGFQTEIRECFEDSIRADQSDLLKRFERLLKRFHNEVVVYRNKRYRCPHFTEVVIRPGAGPNLPVYARNHQTRWFCQLSTDRIREEETQKFLEDAKRFRRTIHKRLIVGLKGIDLNAKLLAQEARIQYLDLKHLNFLMDVYEQPKFIV